MNRTGKIARIGMLLTALMFGFVATLHPLLHDCCGEEFEAACPAIDADGGDGTTLSAGSTYASLEEEMFCPVCSGQTVSPAPEPATVDIRKIARILPERPAIYLSAFPVKVPFPPLAPRPPPIC